MDAKGKCSPVVHQNIGLPNASGWNPEVFDASEFG